MPAFGGARQDIALDFLEALCVLSADAWMDIGKRVQRNVPSTTARRDLRLLVRQRCVAVSAWNLDDRVDTVAWYVSQHVAPGQPRSWRLAFQRAVAGARIAALALLVRRQLGERRFWSLYEPFQRVYPLRRWFQENSSPPLFTESSCARSTGGANVRRSLRTIR